MRRGAGFRSRGRSRLERIGWLAMGWACLLAVRGPASDYHSPFDLAYAPDGALLAVSDHTAKQIVLFKGDGTLHKTIALAGQPAGMAWSRDGSRVYVAERGAWAVAEVDPAQGAVARRFTAGRYPVGLAVGADRLVVCDNGRAELSVVDLKTGAETARVPCVYRPWDVALTPDGAVAVVGNLSPLGDARRPTMGGVVTLVDVAGGKSLGNIPLPPGSINVRGIAVSSDGKWAYVAHSLGRFTLPTTQIERGWVMTHALSIFDLGARKHHATVLLDTMTEGAADPWDVVLSPEGDTAWITLAGVNQVCRLDLKNLHLLLAGKADAARIKSLPYGSIWADIAKNPGETAGLANDLAALYSAGLMQRGEVPADGLRGAAWSSAGGGTLAVAAYFAGEVVLCDPGTLVARSRVSLGPQPAATAEREGERLFHDARQCFQHWMSCASCHPEGRADGLNWDLLNDGMGNPKNTKSLLISHRTPPVMSTGVRESMDLATEKGFTVIQFRMLEQAQLGRVRDYIRSLSIEPSPYLEQAPAKSLSCAVCHHGGTKGSQPKGHMPIAGQLSADAERGLKVFTDAKVGCVKCHPGPLFTDLKMYDVGSEHELDRRADFDTPTCYDLWRTAPYLHDGSAVTLLDMLTTLNKEDKHGRTRHLSADELKALVTYLLSL